MTGSIRRKLTAGLSKTLSIVVAVVIIVAAVVGVLYALSGPVSQSFTVATSGSVGTAGQSMTFSVLPSSGATVTSVAWNFGDGNTQTVTSASTTHTYATGGDYLVFATVSMSYSHIFNSYSTTVDNHVALFPLHMAANLTQAQSLNASVPAINFPVSKNPNPAIFTTGQTVSPVGGFLQTPTSKTWSIQNYVWNYGNGQSSGTILPNSTTLLPSSNVTISYSSTGLYPLALKLTTNSSSSTFSVTWVHTVPVGTTALPYAILTSSGGVLNPNVITSAEVVPGGPSSFDPGIDYETVGFEVNMNIFQTLVQYNGSAAGNFIPILAVALPTTTSGITNNYHTYNFTVRTNQYFSNGDKVTAYDVWYSIVRAMAFAAGGPGTPDWIQNQFLINGSAFSPAPFATITKAVTYSNATNTVAFHFNRVMPPTLAFQVLADPLGAGVIDHSYAESVGAGFNPSNPSTYDSVLANSSAPNYPANLASYNLKMQWSPIGSGPYMVQSLTPGQSVELVPNLKYGGVPGIPAVNKTVVIDWVKTPDTALLMLQDGQADSAYGLPNSDFPAVQSLQSKGLVHIYPFGTLSVFFYLFNINVNIANLKALPGGSGFSLPSNYFADLPTRYAWIDAFNYTNYLLNIFGNAKYGANFGSGYQGILPLGMVYFVPPNKLGGLPNINVANAMGNYSKSAWAGMTINIPIMVYAGDTTDQLAATMWAAELSVISGGHIKASLYNSLTFGGTIGLEVAGTDPMPVFFLGWAPDYPDPSDYVDAMYGYGGAYPPGVNWLPVGSTNTFDYTSGVGYVPISSSNPSWSLSQELVNVANTNSTPTTVTQATAYTWLNGNISAADHSADPATRQHGYFVSELLAIDMGLYVYVVQQNLYWYWRSWLSGSTAFGGYLSQENPMYGGGGDLLYFWLTKG